MKNHILLIIFQSFFFCSTPSMAENPPKVVRHIAEHTTQQPPVRKYDVPNENLYREHLMQWSRYEKVSENSLRVYFSAEHMNCLGHRAVLQEDEAFIKIAIIVGQLVDGDEIACRAFARVSPGIFLLHTQKPIGDRAIVPLTSVELRERPIFKQ